MLRTMFLAGLAAVGILPAAPSPSPTPTASAPTKAKDADPTGLTCVKNPILPYDKRLQFHATALDGPDFDLAQYRGYAMWINILATWCPPCREEQPLVVTKAAAYRDKGVRTVGLFANEADDRVRSYRKKYGIAYPLVRDANEVLTGNLQGWSGEIVFPAHLFIDVAGFLYCYEIGTLDDATLDKILDYLATTTAHPLPPDLESATAAGAHIRS